MIETNECYVCRTAMRMAHSFYPGLCSDCGALNFTKRHSTAHLDGYTALVTGGRLKIGFETALKLLRAGAQVIVTTRFQEDAGARFTQVSDYNAWCHRLRFFAADFRVLYNVQAFIEWVHNEVGTVDILINNAAQTIRRPPAFYRHLIPGEQTTPEPMRPRFRLPMPKSTTNPAMALLSMTQAQDVAQLDGRQVAELSQIPLLPGDESDSDTLFPPNKYDQDGQQEDRRDGNSWMMGLEDVNLIEFLEVMYINAVTPFLLCSRLRKIMAKAEDARPSFIVNVSAMEGNFYDPEKNWRHPHTNMAKAALNMLTRTSAPEFRMARIFMTSVDPGWVTNEKPFPASQARETRRTRMAIDEIDGASRVCDPIFRALNSNEYFAGVLLKNYSVYPW